MSLHELGFGQFFMSQIVDFEKELESIARIIAVHRGICEAVTEKKEIIKISTEGQGKILGVGDFVQYASDASDQGFECIKCYDRKSALERKTTGASSERQIIVSNVDTIFIVTSLNQEFKLSRLERYISAVKETGATPVIVLSKADLTKEVGDFKARVSEIAPGIELLSVSASVEGSDRNGCGIDKLQEFLSPFSTSVFIGSSGVGKSTLINHLTKANTQKTSSISFFSKGSHTTTARKLIFLESGAMIIDTPGMRSFQPIISSESLVETFYDVDSFLGGCKYRNCTHSSEPGCKILEAIASGKLSDRRWKNYLKMKREQEFLEKRGTHAKHKQDREFGKLVKTIVKSKNKGFR